MGFLLLILLGAVILLLIKRRNDKKKFREMQESHVELEEGTRGPSILTSSAEFRKKVENILSIIESSIKRLTGVKIISKIGEGNCNFFFISLVIF